MPRFRTATIDAALDHGIDWGSLTPSGQRAYAEHARDFPSVRRLLTFIVVMLAARTYGKRATQILRQWLPGYMESGRKCDHPACPPTHCRVPQRGQT